VEVTFDIDANGILHVSAKDKASNKEQKIRIEASSGLTDAEIDKMVKQAEQHSADDKKRREEIEGRNQLDALVYRVEKDSAEWVDRLPAEAKSRLDQSLEAGKQALRTGDPDGIRRALDELNAAYSAAGAAMYAANQGSQPAEGPAGGSTANASEPAPDDVVEADYEIVDEGKK
jgi:molecular chaperone DnaK